MMARRTGRQRNQLPNCYYEGYLEKRSFKDKTSRKLWTCLCGNTLFFFNEMRDVDYIDKLDLRGFISVTDDNSQDRNLDAARFNLHMKDGNIKFTAPNAEARELWKGYIYSVAELCIPSSLNLLPGQVHMLKEVVELEKDRIKSTPPTNLTNTSTYVSVQADMPVCFHNVSRLEAELLLEREAKRGNLLLRPGRNVNCFAVSTRQDLDGSIFRHYLVTPRAVGGFTIDVDNPVFCATLQDVINYLVEKTDGSLTPLITEERYEKSIYFIRSDKENGETSVQEASSNVRPIVPPKPGAQKIATPEQVPVEEYCFYLNDKLMEDKKGTEGSPAVPLSKRNVPKKALTPPSVAPRKVAPTTSPPFTNFSTNRDLKMRTPIDPLGQTISELKQKLEKKAKSHESLFPN
ncbi:signal-transducing adaptor protein 1-like isoform X2 [Channa argus]|uniref:signal-transducing adaptor protein 1-like isoform X2 n=1 Tax=Channa argus TaxID=215402 RepID=UPI003522B3BF